MRALIATVILSTCMLGHAFAQTVVSPDGYWKTVGDVSNVPRSVIKMWTEHGELFGKVMNGFPVNGEPLNPYCVNCSGKFHNKLIVGLTTMWGYAQNQSDPNQWLSGKILDPEGGHVYDANITLNPDGKTLELKAFIGIPLFGRTQTWYRLTPEQYAQIMKKHPIPKLPPVKPA